MVMCRTCEFVLLTRFILDLTRNGGWGPEDPKEPKLTRLLVVLFFGYFPPRSNGDWVKILRVTDFQ